MKIYWKMLKFLYLLKQQTPKLEAQFPSGVPPVAAHSSGERQRPLVTGMVVAGFVGIVVWHSSLGNDRMEKRENASGKNEITFRKIRFLIVKKKLLIKSWNKKFQSFLSTVREFQILMSDNYLKNHQGI